MDRSRSKRSYYYDHQDYDNETLARTKPRYSNNNHHYAAAGNRHRGGGGGGHRTPPDPAVMVTTTYRILCHDMKAGGVIGKSGSIIKYIRQHTGAWINVHELVPGDSERIIEISDTRRRDPEGRMPSFSPAQEALFLIHDRIIESEGHGHGFNDEFGNNNFNNNGSNVNNSRACTRLVVSRMHVGSLLGKGGKIIEQMRIETKTQIRILPRDHTLPRCVSMSEEIVQIVGDVHNVKNAVSIISSRLRESQHRDRSQYGRTHSPERFLSPDDDSFTSTRRSSLDGPTFGARSNFPNSRSSSYASCPSGFPTEPEVAPVADNVQSIDGEELVFRMLCPTAKVDTIVGESDGIIELLRNEIGVDVKVCDPVSGSEEQVVIVSSEEGPDDELFPAQEALLHIQTRIVDLFPDKDNIITTRLLVSSNDIGCLEGKEASLSEIRKLTGVNIQILPKEEVPKCVLGDDELVQIVGEITAAREALVEVTSRLRSHFYRDISERDHSPSQSTQGPVTSNSGLEVVSPMNTPPTREGQSGSDPPPQSAAATHLAKENGNSVPEKRNESDRREDVPNPVNRIPMPLVTRSILEVVIPEHSVPKFLAKSKKLSQISELSGANVVLLEDKPDSAQRTVQISGTPEQAERAQSLLQGFILSIQDDG